MGLNARRPHNLPVLCLSNTSNASTSNSMDDDPHTPLPHTPFAYERSYPMIMTPTPSITSFELNESIPNFGKPQSSSVSSSDLESSFGSLSSSNSWSSSSSLSGLVVGGSMDGDRDRDQEVWTDREDGILESFLNKPLRPFSTPYPPSTLPPPGALDELTSQILHFHRPDDISTSSPISTSTSLPSLTSTASSGTTAQIITACKSKSHNRSRSLSTQPWTHSWKSTRRRLFQIARKEAIGGNREDRWKGRTEMGQDSIIQGGGGGVGGGRGGRDGGIMNVVPGGMTVKRENGILKIQRNGSYSGLEIESVAEDLQEVGIDQGMGEDGSIGVNRLGQVLRLSTSLQRSSRIAPQMMGGNSSDITKVSTLSEIVQTTPRRVSGATITPRAPSLLQRGRSFTAEDFDTYMSLSTSPPRHEPSSASIHRTALHVEVESDDDDDSMECDEAALFMPSRAEIAQVGRTHARTASETSTIVADDRTLSTPSPERGPSAPAITLTQNSPSPDDQSDESSRQGWNFALDTPTMEKGDPFAQALHHGSLVLGRPPVFKAGRHRPPPLHRSFSSSDATQQGKTALSEFMGPNSANSTDNNSRTIFPSAFAQAKKNGNLAAAWNLPLISPTDTGSGGGLSLPLHMSKRQKFDMNVAVPPPMTDGGLFVGIGASFDRGGLRSPFDEARRF